MTSEHVLRTSPPLFTLKQQAASTSVSACDSDDARRWKTFSTLTCARKRIQNSKSPSSSNSAFLRKRVKSYDTLPNFLSSGRRRRKCVKEEDRRGDPQILLSLSTNLMRVSGGDVGQRIRRIPAVAGDGAAVALGAAACPVLGRRPSAERAAAEGAEGGKKRVNVERLPAIASQ